MKTILKTILKNMLKKRKISNLIILESKPDFSDNTKAIYDYLIENKFNNKYRIVWLVEDKSKFNNIKIKNVKFICFKDYLRKIYFLSNAKYIINCNRPITKFNSKTVSMNLWHGTILKDLSNLNCMEEENIDFLLCPSIDYLEIYEEQLHINKKKILIGNNPRNDWLYSNEINMDELFNHEFSKYIIWMPTFRKARDSNRIDSMYKFKLGIPIIENTFQLDEINEYLKQKNILLIIKPHFVQDDKEIKLCNFSNIKIINNEFLLEKHIELYKILGKCNALLTDYSSVYYDFLILDRPIGFTIDDIDEYSKGKGFIVDDPKILMPGKKIMSFKDLLEFIENLSEDIDDFTLERKKIADKTNTFFDNNNTERIVDFLKL